MNLEQLQAICPATPAARLELFVEPLEAAMTEFSIDSAARRAQFLAQVAHESAAFRYTAELATGDAYEPPSRLATRLGNTQAGDGRRYKGRGLMQITGRKNYREAGLALTLPLITSPEILEELVPACRSAGWFWTVGAGLNLGPAAHAHGIPERCDLNDLADAGDFLGIMLAINGGHNGEADRLALLKRAQAVM